MKRIPNIWFSAAVLPFAFLLGAGCQTIQFQQPSISSSQDWLVDSGDLSRSRSYDEDLQAPLTLEWEYNAAAAFGQGSPLLLKGVVLVANKKGEMHAIELKTGAKRGIKSFGEGIEGSPIIHEGKLIVASAWGKRTLTSFDLKKGSFVWRNKGVPIESGMVLVDGVLVAADVDGFVTGYDPSTGKMSWSQSLGKGISVQSALLQVGDLSVFVADDAGNAFLFNASDGRQLWTQKLSGPSYEGGSTFGDRIIVPTTRGALDVLDASTGKVLWRNELSSANVRMGSSAVDDELVVVAATDGIVRAFNSTDGSTVWESAFPDAIVAAPLITNRLVFVGSMGRHLYALDRLTGEVKWETALRGRIKSAMAVADGGLIVLSEPRYVTYFKEESNDN